jgi:serine/threonine-protein kinase
MIGKTLLQYKILQKIGEGGMGVVYKAQDTKLGREVALKALPEEFAQDRERLARFEREAKLLASLNHPNIATIYGLEESEGLNFLTLELVEGETLAGKLTSGPLKVQSALEMCRQIAEALESAHQKGIIHRDLKPSNIKVTPKGKVKVLDFGLAKAFEVAEVGDAAGMDPYKSPTMTIGSSRSGVIMGTAAYMSPEQARGKPLDKRTDIWSFGCVFYELLTGQQLFKGETTSDMVAGILKQEPDWKALPQDLPVRIQELLRRCLHKDPNKRLHDIADARIEIEEALAKPLGEITDTLEATDLKPSERHKRSIPWSFTLLVAVAAIIVASFAVLNLKRTLKSEPKEVMRFIINPPDNYVVSSPDFGNRITLSPDGKNLVYSAFNGDDYLLYRHPLNKFESIPIPGTEGANHPFFSPDGKQIGFFAENKLKKVYLSGGNPMTVCDLFYNGATWAPDGTIIAGSADGLFRVSASGGIPQELTTVDEAKGETSHRWPEILPGGKAVLFTIMRGILEDAQIAVYSLETGERQILLDETGFNARYLSSGHIVYIRGGFLMAIPFDIHELKVTSSPVALPLSIQYLSGGAACFRISNNGTLVYLTGNEATRRSLVWVDRTGNEVPLKIEHRSYRIARISPDGKKVALGIAEGSIAEIWIYDIEHTTLTRFEYEGNNHGFAWTQDGKRLMFSSNRGSDNNIYNIYSKQADGSEEAKLLFSSEKRKYYPSVSADGSLLAFYEWTPTDRNRDIGVLRLKDNTASSIFNSSAQESAPAFSPDGRRIAYESDESGRDEIYVSPSSKAGGRRQISTNGGTEPLWSPDGRELFYRVGQAMMAVPVETISSFRHGKPKKLFDKLLYTHGFTASYDIHPDGDRFLMIKTPEAWEGSQINVVLNWFEELNRHFEDKN